ncbi:MAG: hypothetical protein ACYDH9_22925 [Limisphaerales bacterium]
MKTLRELLLERHRDAESDLDAIRRDVVMNCLGTPSPAASAPETGAGWSPARVIEVLWGELVWPCRRAWIGLAAAWLMILFLNHPAADGPPVARVKPEAPSAAMITLLREQRELARELTSLSAEPEAPAPAPQPHSELQSSTRELV